MINTKFLLSAICICFIAFTGNSQSVNEDVNLKKLLFNNFLAGKVFIKKNQVVQAPLNYNTDKQNFVFIDNNQYKELTGLEQIDSIVVDNVKFVPLENKFFECTTNKDLFVLYYNIPVSNDIATDKTGTHKKSASEVSNTLSNVYSLRNFKNQSDVKFVKHFWIKDKSSFIELRYPKQIAKVFNIDRTQLTDFVEKNKIDFNFEPDILKLIDFINTAKKG